VDNLHVYERDKTNSREDIRNKMAFVQEEYKNLQGVKVKVLFVDFIPGSISSHSTVLLPVSLPSREWGS